MAKHRALIIGAGRIGVGYNWPDDSYTHAGAYVALKDRVEVVGVVDPDEERLGEARRKWGFRTWNSLLEALEVTKPDLVSIATQPYQQASIMGQLRWRGFVRGIWCEKPCYAPFSVLGIPVQVNYLRRADNIHRLLAEKKGGKLFVYANDDIHTRCHFEDLAQWWGTQLEYRVFAGPCSYILRREERDYFFNEGGINPGSCMKGMLENLLDAVDGKANLWSPPY